MKVVIVNSDVKNGGKTYKQGKEYDDLTDKQLKEMEGNWEEVVEKKAQKSGEGKKGAKGDKGSKPGKGAASGDGDKENEGGTE